ncbi:MAG TPA: hypothetical protein ENJ01_09855 [Gammaproteobacteria bacterium]|nr:hypothetical protein [Gammaproteobacteria bacterium]
MTRVLQQDYSRERHTARNVDDGFVQEYIGRKEGQVSNLNSEELERFIRSQGVDTNERATHNVAIPVVLIIGVILVFLGWLLASA